MSDYERGINVTVRDLRECLDGLPNDMDVIIPVFNEDDNNNNILGFRHIRAVGILENRYEEKPALCLASSEGGADMYTLMAINKLDTVCKKGLF